MSAAVDDPTATPTIAIARRRDPHRDLHVADLGGLYAPPRAPVMVDVPPIRYLVAEGTGDLETSLAWAEAVDGLRDAERRAHPDGVVDEPAPLEVLHHGDAHWTLLLAIRLAGRPRGAAPDSAHTRTLAEGWAAQLLYVGDAAGQAAAWRRLERFIEARGYTVAGPRHEIVLDTLDGGGHRRRVLRRAVTVAEIG